MPPIPVAVLLTLSLLGLALPAQAQKIYQTTDDEGNVIYSDTPGSDQAQTVELPRTNTFEAPAAAPRADSPPAKPQPAAASQATVTITSPANETTIPIGAGGIFDVEAEVENGLANGQSLQLSFDGEPWGDPQQAGVWHLTDIYRGPHTLVVELLDGSGNTLASSPAVQVFVLRRTIQ